MNIYLLYIFSLFVYLGNFKVINKFKNEYLIQLLFLAFCEFHL